LQQFDVTCQHQGVQLSWTTSNEENNAQFEIEQSVDASHWVKVGEVAGAGNDHSKNDYQFEVMNTSNQGNYFRLKQLDIDHKFTYSEVKFVQCEEQNETVQIYPNPTEDGIHVVLDDYENTNIIIMDIQGNILIQQNLSESNYVAFNTLSPGDYVAKIVEPNQPAQMVKIEKR
jgi:hypothetical protein